MERQKKAIELTESCLPLSTQVAKKIGLIDDYFGDDPISFRQQILQRAEAMAQSPDYLQKLALKNKKRLQDEQFKPLEDYRREELEQIKVNLSGPAPSYHMARYQFVYKVTPSETPLHLAKHRQ